jgi:arginine-tRNA-protein transferase
MYTDPVSGKKRRVGSYHQCYRLNGRLVAVGVLDLLPKCVSGVYFFYLAEFKKFNMGKLSALQEIALALEHEYDYYYMGKCLHVCSANY